MRIWRGDATGGDFEDYTLDQNEGEVVLDVDPPHPGDRGPGPGVPLELQGRQVRVAARPRSTASPRLMCMTRMDQLPEGPVTVDADEDLPDHPRPRHRRLVQLRDGRARPGVPARRRCPRAATACSSSDVERGQEFRKCIECFMCQDVCHVIRDHEEQQGPLRRARGSSSATPSSRCTPSTPTTAATWSARRWASGYCNITKCCTEVCPEHIKITDNAIIPLKERVVDAHYDPSPGSGARSCGAPRSAPPTTPRSSPPPSAWRTSSPSDVVRRCQRLARARRARCRSRRRATVRVVLEFPDAPEGAAPRPDLHPGARGRERGGRATTWPPTPSCDSASPTPALDGRGCDRPAPTPCAKGGSRCAATSTRSSPLVEWLQRRAPARRGHDGPAAARGRPRRDRASSRRT